MDGSWFGGNMAPVARLYWAYFGRIPDASGLTYWTAKHRSGTSTASISNGFAGSSEFRSTYGSLSNMASCNSCTAACWSGRRSQRARLLGGSACWPGRPGAR